MSVAVTVGIILWTTTYVFRVANKDMTYVKQLKDYEDAVLRKRLEELQVRHRHGPHRCSREGWVDAEVLGASRGRGAYGHRGGESDESGVG